MYKKSWRFAYVGCVVSTAAVATSGVYYYTRRNIVVDSRPTVRGKFDLATVKGFEAVKRFNEFDLNNEVKCLRTVSSLDAAGWCLLALEDHGLFRFFKPKIAWSASDSDASSLITGLNLDARWKSALNWCLMNICADEDLYCQETTPLTRESSKSERLMKLLRIILYKTESAECDDLVERNILYILYGVLNEFRNSNAQITIIVLKIISNIAQKSKIFAEQICDSPMLELLHNMIHRPVQEPEAILAHKICINALNALGVRGAYGLPPGIFEFHRPPAAVAPQLDVVLVHGLRGAAFRTWRQRDDPKAATTLFWPKKWLAKDIRQPIRILALDYPSQLLKMGSVMHSISARSDKFQREFQEASIGDRPVVFICHSMGGLLIKHMLINNEKLLNNTVGILFMSTPHHGSPLAGYGFIRPSDDLQLLRVDSEINQRLHADFKQLAPERISLFVTVLESQETPIFGMRHFIVPHSSGVIDHGTVYHVDAHHHQVCKPVSRGDAAYGIVLNFVRDAIRNISATGQKS